MPPKRKAPPAASGGNGRIQKAAKTKSTKATKANDKPVSVAAMKKRWYAVSASANVYSSHEEIMSKRPNADGWSCFCPWGFVTGGGRR